MSLLKKSFLQLLYIGTLSMASNVYAQNGADYYDDYDTFMNDYEELDAETRGIFGKFFQSALYAGTGMFTGELASANTAGVNVGIKFIYYFDKMWGAEIGGFFNLHRSLYTEANTGITNGQLELSTRLIPVVGGLRFTFDTENMSRGLAQMNPYLSSGPALIFRQESVLGEPSEQEQFGPDASNKYGASAIVGSTNFGIHFGGGAEFDVYKNRVFAGLDLRYYMMFWSDADLLIGNAGRQGSYVTVLGSVSYTY